MKYTKKQKILGVVVTAAIALGAAAATSWPFFNLTVRCRQPKKQIRKKWFSLRHTRINHPRYKFAEQYENGKAWCASQPMRQCHIQSVDGLTLYAQYLPAAEHTRRILILCHGYKGSGFGDFANIARFLHEHDCGLLFIDERCCGESEGNYITFGAREQTDILRWAWFVAERNPKNLPIYLYGESMGASSALMSTAHPLPKAVKGLIADCGFRSMRNQLQDMAKSWFHLHWIGFLLLRLDLLCRIFAGFRMEESDTLQAMQKNHLPVLFFHGLEDSYVAPENSVMNYTLCQAPKELVLIPEARHLCASYEAPELYRKKLLEFFQENDGRV